MEMEQQFARAEMKHMRVSSSKVRRYLNAIKGMKYAEAVATLKFMPSPTAEELHKVLVSAGANAEENHNMTKDELYVFEATADQGPTMKRFRPRAMGRGMKIRKRTSHVTIILSNAPRSARKK
jgi:large subunit ribosomal protein L22